MQRFVDETDNVIRLFAPVMTSALAWAKEKPRILLPKAAQWRPRRQQRATTND
jgi:hypothetical protein